MAETRATKAARDVDGATTNRIEAIERALALQDERMQTMLEAVNVMTSQMQRNATMNGEGNQRGGGEGFNQDRNEANHRHHHNNNSGMTRMAKIDFPRFDGSKLKEWLSKAEEFFEIAITPEESKVGIASIHFDGEASTWHLALKQEDENVMILRSWRLYKNRIKERFEEVLDDPMAELKELKETEGIAEYHKRFELIRARLRMSKEYLLSAYLAGLRLDTQMHIRMFQPQTTRQCLVLGRLYEMAHPKKTSTNTWSNQKQVFGNNQQKGLLSIKKDEVVKAKDQVGKLRPFLSQAEMSERRAKGMCYYCDEKFLPEHALKHRKTQLYSMDVEDAEEDENWEEEDTEGREVAQISINAVVGSTDYTTMRVRGTQGKKNLYILLDSGSTHNFIDTKIADILGCQVEPAGRKQVAVADGSKIGVCGKVSNLRWKFQNYEFKADFMVIPLGGHDIVLGVQWLSTLGPITWDFKELEMSFKWHNKRVMLHGIKAGSVREVKAKRVENNKDEDIQLHMIYTCEENEMELWNLKTEALEEMNDEEQKELSLLTEEYEMIFEEPKQLPPFRDHHNHKITLLEGSNPVNQRPYRYAVYQKNEIDKMVQELLKAGTVQEFQPLCFTGSIGQEKGWYMEIVC